MNYETVKQFNNETLEISRYNLILDKIKTQAQIVQQSLSNLNIGQTVIFQTGLTINLLMASIDVFTGIRTPGDFVML